MNIVVTASREAFDKAMKHADAVGPDDLPEGVLAAPADGGLLGRLDDVWGEIKAAFRTAFVFGRDKAADLLRAAVAKAEKVLTEAGNKARDLQLLLLKKLQTFLQDMIQETVSLIASEYTVSTRTFRLTAMTCKQKLILTGSISTNITELFTLVSSGELEVEAEYSAAP